MCASILKLLLTEKCLILDIYGNVLKDGMSGRIPATFFSLESHHTNFTPQSLHQPYILNFSYVLSFLVDAQMQHNRTRRISDMPNNHKTIIFPLMQTFLRH